MSHPRELPNYLDGGCRILLISPQRWDGFQVSKHHYAIELAKLGNEVYFVDPPNNSGKAVDVVSCEEDERLKVVRYGPWFPYVIKFRARWLFRVDAEKEMAKTVCFGVVEESSQSFCYFQR